MIIVSIVHIQGPLKGEIQELSKETIGIGRHPLNDVRFPKDLTIVSRNHAEIVREGNRFRLVDKSANGTYVNGKRVEEIFLKDGDVIEFAEGGPKVSFLTEMREGEPREEERPAEMPAPHRAAPQEKRPAADPLEPLSPPPPPRTPAPGPSPEPPRAAFRSPEPTPAAPQPPFEIPVQTVAASLVIQYGPAVRSYRELPVTIGHHPKCGFVLDQPGILDQHAQILYGQGRYWIKDLTGQMLVRVNQEAVSVQAPLSVNDTIALGPKGPFFRFVGEGRLAEAEEQPPESSAQAGQMPPEGQAGPKAGTQAPQAAAPKGGLFSKVKKKLF